MSNGSFLSGALWSSLNAAASIGLPLVIFILFAHVLSPEQVGIVAVAIAWAEIVKTFGFTGFYEALLQQTDDRRRCHETAAFIFLAASTILLLPYLAILWATSLSAPDLRLHFWLLASIGLRIPLDLAALQPQAQLAQDLAYRKLGIRSAIANLVAGAAGVAIACFGDPLVGLVVYQVGQSALVTVVTLMGRTAAWPRMHVECFRRMLNQATMATVVRIVSISNTQADQVIIAGLLGSGDMAYYNLGKRLETAFTAVSNSFTSILFQPLFATQALSAREASLRRGLAFLTMTCGLAAAVFMANADALVSLVFGAKWLPAAPLASILVFNGFLRALSGLHGALMSVSGRNHTVLAIVGSLSLAGMVATLITAPISLDWCAAAMTLKTSAAVVWSARAIRSEFIRPARAYLVDLILPFSLMVGAAMVGHWAATSILPLQPGLALTLAIVSISGATSAICCGIYFGHLFFGLLIATKRSQRACERILALGQRTS